MRIHHVWLLGLPLALLAAGCDWGGQTGGEVKELDGGSPNAGEQCTDEAEASEELSSTSAVSPLGFSADDILAFAQGQHSAATQWLTPQELTRVVANASGETELTVTVSYEGGAVRFIDSEIAPADEGNLLVDRDGLGSCPDRVDIEVRVTAVTTDGALDETRTATLRATNRHFAVLMIPLDLDELQGSLTLSTPDAPDAKLEQVALHVQLGDGLFQGRLSGLVTQSDGMVAYGAGFEVLHWGPNVCDTGEVPLAADEAMAMLAVVNDHAPYALTWDNGDESLLTLSVSSNAEWACLNGEGQVLAAELVATTDDGRIDSTLAVELIGTYATSGTLEQVHLLFDGYFAKAVPVADFESSFGISGVDLSSYQSATMSFGTIYDTTATPVAAHGALEVLGLIQADCSEQEEPLPEGASPGCAGDEVTTVDSASW